MNWLLHVDSRISRTSKNVGQLLLLANGPFTQNIIISLKTYLLTKRPISGSYVGSQPYRDRVIFWRSPMFTCGLKISCINLVVRKTFKWTEIKKIIQFNVRAASAYSSLNRQNEAWHCSQHIVSPVYGQWGDSGSLPTFKK